MKKLLISLSVLAYCIVSTHAQTNKPIKSSRNSYGDNKEAGKYAKIRGINMYYETYGEGKPLLIIHGNGGSIHDFAEQIPYFSKKYKVIVADSRDHGHTLDTLAMQDSLSYEQMSDDFSALLSYLKIDSAYVLGWSDGGINGLLLAMRHPEKVKKLAITGANLWPDTTSLQPSVLHTFESDSKSLYAQKPSVPRTVLLRHLKLMLTQPHIKPSALGAIKCPTLVMGGDHDMIKPEHTLLIAKSILNSDLWISPNSGHGFLISKYEQFNREVDDFFQRPLITR